MAVHSKDGITWLTKLERISRLSASRKDIVFNNIGHIISIEMLKEIYSQLNGNKAVGIDEITKDKYGKNLKQNLEELLKQIRRGTYKPKPSRITEIPKEDGSYRPLAIACFEDKIVQYAVRNWNGAVVEVDIRKYFDTIPHKELLEILEKKISDKRFLGLVKTLMKASVEKKGTIIENTKGSPQGSILSPILSNIYLHYVIDDWFEKIKQTHLKGRCGEIRYADDVVFTFQYKAEAERFFKVLPMRLKKYGLEINMEKSKVVEAVHKAAETANKVGRKLPTFLFLGFVCYRGKTLSGYWRLKYSSRGDRITGKLKGMKRFLRENLNTKGTTATLQQVIKVVRGWVNYHAISDNERKVSRFIYHSKWMIYKWINRRGRKKKMNWKRFAQLLQSIQFPVKWKIKSMFPNYAV